MKRLQIGMVTLCYEPTINGVVRMINLYKDQLEQLGHTVTIFTLKRKRAKDAASSVVESFGFPMAKSGYYVNFFLGNEAQVQLKQMDILHCHHLFLSNALARRYGNCPVVYTNHTRYDLYAKTLLPLPPSLIDKLMKYGWSQACRSADLVIAPSKSIKQIMRRAGVQQPIELIENGIDQRPFQSPSTPLKKSDLGIPETAVLLIYVGRFSKEKNLLILFEQFAKAIRHTPKLYLMLVGDGPEMKQLRHHCTLLNIESHVKFCGAVPYEAVPNYLAAADIFVTASNSEVHPLSLIEAMAAGLPIVAPDAPGVRDIVDHDSSGLLMAASGADLAIGVLKLVLEPETCLHMAQAAKNKSKRYTIERTAKETVDVYRTLLLERPDLIRKKRVWSIGLLSLT